MKRLLFFIITFSMAIGAIQFKPIAYISHFSTGSDCFYDEIPISIFGGGLKVNYHRENINLDAIFLNHRLWGISAQKRSKYNSFNNTQGLSWGADPTGSGDSFDFDFTDLNVRYNTSSGELFFGKMNPEWGEGNSKLTFSDKSPSFPLFGFNWKVQSNISVEYFHGQLISSIDDLLYEDFYTDAGEIIITQTINRNVAAHRIIWDITDRIRINAMESVVYAVRGIDFHYLMPIIPFWSLQHYLGDTDNIQMAGELIYSPSNKLKLYGTIFMDEWAPEKTFSEDNRNWFAYQCGLTWAQLLNNSDQFRLEYTWTDNRIYRHRFEVNDFYSHGFPLGFWAGPHAEEIFFSYNIDVFGMEWLMKISDAKRGELQYQYNDSIYDVARYEGLVEEKLFIDLEVTKPVYKTLFMTAGISYVDWKNAGFNPSGSDIQALQDVQKTSFNLSLNYNY